MKTKIVSLKDLDLKKSIKNMVIEAKQQNLIKPHTEAFKIKPAFKNIDQLIEK